MYIKQFATIARNKTKATTIKTFSRMPKNTETNKQQQNLPETNWTMYGYGVHK